MVRSLGADSCSALLVTCSCLASRLEAVNTPALVVIELASLAEVDASPERIPGSIRTWRPAYQQEITELQPLDGLRPLTDDFTSFAQQLGIDDDTEVVIVDRKYDATRLWWLFVLHGKRDVMVLDGGYLAWQAGGWPMSIERPVVERRGRWVADPPRRSLVAEREDVERLSTMAAARLWDVRSVDEYSGACVMPGALCGGRIPWASARLDWNLFRESDGLWLDVAEVRGLARKHLDLAPDDDDVHTFYCQSAVRTTQLIFALHRAGWPLERLRNYDGSWVEWSHMAGEDDVLVGPPSRL